MLFYPKTYISDGYDNTWIQGEIDIPATAHEDLSTLACSMTHWSLRRPTTGKWARPTAGCGKRTSTSTRRPFAFPWCTPTLACLNSPLRATRSSHTSTFCRLLASLVGAPANARADWQGVYYSDLILNRSPKPPQDYTVFTYDDFQSGQAKGPYPRPPNHVVGIREQRYKLARYYDANGKVPDQWEMYDIRTDPLERTNLAYRHCKRTAEQERQYRRLRRKLARVEQARLKPLSRVALEAHAEPAVTSGRFVS